MPFAPKDFYRRLDSLLLQIDAGSATDEWFEWLLREILERFGDMVGLTSARLYREVDDGFLVEWQLRSGDADILGMVVGRTYPPIELVLARGVSFIGAETPGRDVDLEARLGGGDSVALLINSDPRRILAFGLAPGWELEHVDLAMHTIRNAVNNRLSVVDLHLDLAQLGELQKALIPERAPEMPGFSLAARCLPYAPIGGDFYDFQRTAPDIIALSLGDASGHGLPAALVARDVVTGLRMAAQSDLKITATVRRLNRVIATSSLSSRFVSLFFGELETNGNLFYVNAGHPPALLFKKKKVEQLRIGGIVLGPLDDAVFKRGFAHLDRGATLVVMTDGLLERKSPRGKLFGNAGVERAVKPLQGEPAGVILEAVLAAAEHHAAGLPATDDVSLIVVTRQADYRATPTRRLETAKT